MTNFDKLVAGGPEALAYAFTKTKITTTRKALAKAGIEYANPSNELFHKIYKEHYDWLTAECKENEHG